MRYATVALGAGRWDRIMHNKRFRIISALAVITGCLLTGCNRDAADDRASGAGGRRGRPKPDAEDRPSLEFPQHVRSKDPAVNKFIEAFYEACYLGEYDKFRLMMSSRVDPFTPDRFKRALTAVEFVRIESIETLPEVTDVPPPIYLVRSRVFIRQSVRKDEPEKTIAILVFKEAGKWVMAPAPKALRDGLDALYQAEEAEGDEEQADDGAGSPQPESSGGPT